MIFLFFLVINTRVLHGNFKKQTLAGRTKIIEKTRINGHCFTYVIIYYYYYYVGARFSRVENHRLNRSER